MSEEFHEWLAQCPVDWWRVQVVKEYKDEDGQTHATHTIYGFVADED